MKRTAPFLLAFTSLLWTSLALAQPASTGSSAISGGLEVSAGGKQFDQASAQAFVGQAECEKNVEFEFVTQNFLVNVNVLELWVSRGVGNDCSLATNRQNNANQQSVCRRVASLENVLANARVRLSTTAVALFSEKGDKCEEATSQAFNAYLVPLPSPTLEGTGTAPDVLAGATPLKATFTLYTRTPAEPTGISGSSGETSLTVRWKRPAGFNEFTRYRIYFDVGQGGAECGSGGLLADTPPGDLPDQSAVIRVQSADNGSTSASLSGLDGLVEIGDSVQAGVVTVDAAGNWSPMSELVCIERVETDGFYDRYKKQNGKGLDSCSMHAPGQASFSGFGTLTMLALALVARRRRNT